MNSIKSFIKNEISGWKRVEVFWLVFAVAIITGLFIYWGDNLMGIISATTGVACVVCTGKGKLSAYIFGLVNCVLYAIISYNAKYYGEVMFNVISIPLQFVGLFVWSKHMSAETNEVEKRSMTINQRVVLTIVIILGILAYGSLLKVLNGNLPYIDALTTVMSLVAMIISIKMFTEQWVLWLIIDTFTIALWAVNFANNQESVATLIMWLVYWFNALFSYFKWRRESNS